MALKTIHIIITHHDQKQGTPSLLEDLKRIEKDETIPIHVRAWAAWIHGNFLMDIQHDYRAATYRFRRVIEMKNVVLLSKDKILDIVIAVDHDKSQRQDDDRSTPPWIQRKDLQSIREVTIDVGMMAPELQMSLWQQESESASMHWAWPVRRRKSVALDPQSFGYRLLLKCVTTTTILVDISQKNSRNASYTC
ncbi:hypothetical protein HDU76_005573 [Blyttiomyces sp. JEL0837]|nr:hypothetical protein HDU76_005573 [Blyttiomyces sp. JEL0837]